MKVAKRLHNKWQKGYNRILLNVNLPANHGRDENHHEKIYAFDIGNVDDDFWVPVFSRGKEDRVQPRYQADSLGELLRLSWA